MEYSETFSFLSLCFYVLLQLDLDDDDDDEEPEEVDLWDVFDEPGDNGVEDAV